MEAAEHKVSSSSGCVVLWGRCHRATSSCARVTLLPRGVGRRASTLLRGSSEMGPLGTTGLAFLNRSLPLVTDNLHSLPCILNVDGGVDQLSESLRGSGDDVRSHANM